MKRTHFSRWIGLVVVLFVALGAMFTAATPAWAQTGGGCAVSYTIANQWNTGFTVDVKITNNGATAINGWTLTWSFANGQQVTSSWNAAVTQTGANVSASNPAGHWNGNIAANGGSVSFGFQGTHTGVNAIPASFSVNGVVCNGGPVITDTPTRTVTGVTPTSTATPTSTFTSTPPTPGTGVCQVVYTQNQWSNGFTADVKVINNSASTINDWTLTWSFANGQQVTSSWNATVVQTGANVAASNPASHWNGVIGANGGSVSFGVQGTHSGTNTVPGNFVLNGTPCNGGSVITNTPTPTRTPTVGTVTFTPTPTLTPTGPTRTPTNTVTPGTHLENPFVGARGYLNPDYVAKVQQAASETGGTLGAQMALVANYSTAVWMDRIAAITDGLGLVGHLNEALAQQQSSSMPVAITIVVYDLPNRDCAALASNGELLISQNGLNRYKAEYIDPIVSILSNPAYSSLRIVVVLEPDSLPNLITNTSIPACAEAQSSGAYVQGIQYAINRLHPISNVYIYLDVAHSGWLGWDSNFNPTVQLYTQVINGTTAGLNSIDGFISNTANYTPFEELFLPDPNLMVGGNPIKSSRFYEWNPYFDELDFATALRNRFISAGFPGSIGMLIDTSRNGWGGPNRPTAVSTSTDLNTYVDQSRIDRRPHRGGWCNQAGAGIGARPQANPVAGVDAFVWVKPPGESDGVSQDGIPDPTDPNKKFDAMCDPNARNRYNSSYPTNALPNAPHAGRWFPEQFTMLVQNAYPPLVP